MNTKTALSLCCLVTLALSAYVASVYASLPQVIPTHWDINGKVNGYGPKSTLFFFAAMPLMSILLMVGLPWLSPKNFSIDSFRRTFNYIMVIVTLLMAYIAVVSIYATRTPAWDLTKPLFSGIMLFIGLLGNLMGKVQRNFFVGIRTPWTLASDKVWVATHRLGARLMTAAGIGGAILIWIGVPVMVAFIAFMVLTLYPVLYSLLLYKKLEKTQSV